VASKSLVEWLKILWENWRMSAWRVVGSGLNESVRPSPAARGFAPLL
jgi:hypothetical protein